MRSRVGFFYFIFKWNLGIDFRSVVSTQPVAGLHTCPQIEKSASSNNHERCLYIHLQKSKPTLAHLFRHCCGCRETIEVSGESTEHVDVKKYTVGFAKLSHKLNKVLGGGRAEESEGKERRRL